MKLKNKKRRSDQNGRGRKKVNVLVNEKKDTHNIPASPAREQTQVQCLECKILYENDSSDKDWVECKTCLGWYHISCAGLDDLSED